jgi:hypothetical protein
MRLTGIPVLSLSLCEGDTHAYLGSALGVLLSRTALDLDMRASQYALTYPIEIPELSHLPRALRVYFTKTGRGRGGRDRSAGGHRSVASNVVPAR